MYPLNMTLLVGVGFALANDEEEHKALTEAGYGPVFVAKEESIDGQTVEAVRAKLDAAGIAYDKRLGLVKLIEMLPA